jgi:hypothetical protein
MVQTDTSSLNAGTYTTPPLETYIFPTSFAQQRIWFLDQLDPGSTTYNIRHLYRLRGALDVPRLERALNKILARHESLRTTFATRDGAPVQIIHSHLTVPLNLVDLHDHPPEQREAEAQRLSLIQLNRSFNLEQGPLLRVTLYRLGEDLHLLLTVMHHIISDGCFKFFIATSPHSTAPVTRTRSPNSPYSMPTMQSGSVNGCAATRWNSSSATGAGSSLLRQRWSCTPIFPVPPSSRTMPSCCGMYWRRS